MTSTKAEYGLSRCAKRIKENAKLSPEQMIQYIRYGLIVLKRHVIVFSDKVNQSKNRGFCLSNSDLKSNTYRQLRWLSMETIVKCSCRFSRR
jgi:hypothetical protein